VIVPTERSDLHLVWLDSKLFVKPLPTYLMDTSIWKDILTAPTKASDRSIYEDARGFLLSYMWLICTEIDHSIAIDRGLLSRHITWPQWVTFTKALVQNIDLERPEHINKRFRYGELRLARLNMIYRFTSKEFGVMIRGYRYGYHQYSTFLERNFTWVLTVVVYITLVLTAMQVGLGTAQLRDNAAFNRASYGFTVFAIISPLILCTGITFWILMLIVFNFLNALRKRVAGAKQQSTTA